MARRWFAALALAGGSLISLLPTGGASADCLAFEVYTYHQGDPGTRHYVSGAGPYQCVPFTDQGWPTLEYDRAQHQQHVAALPDGTVNGAGVAVWVPAP